MTSTDTLPKAPDRDAIRDLQRQIRSHTTRVLLQSLTALVALAAAAILWLLGQRTIALIALAGSTIAAGLWWRFGPRPTHVSREDREKVRERRAQDQAEAEIRAAKRRERNAVLVP
ncbi:MAG: hypothetical protein AAGC63_15785, partial [Propionicimonas sp.]